MARVAVVTGGTRGIGEGAPIGEVREAAPRWIAIGRGQANHLGAMCLVEEPIGDSAHDPMTVRSPGARVLGHAQRQPDGQ